MTNVEQVIYECLVASGTSLYSSNVARVYCPQLPASFANTATSVVFTVTGGNGPHPRGATYDNMVMIKCYGGAGTFSSAQTLARLVHDRLHNFHGALTSGSILLSMAVSAIQTLKEPDTGWPFTLQTFRVVVQ